MRAAFSSFIFDKLNYITRNKNELYDHISNIRDIPYTRVYHAIRRYFIIL